MASGGAELGRSRSVVREESPREPPLAADDAMPVQLELVAVRAASAQLLTLTHERPDLLVQLFDLRHGAPG